MPKQRKFMSWHAIVIKLLLASAHMPLKLEQSAPQLMTHLTSTAKIASNQLLCRTSL